MTDSTRGDSVPSSVNIPTSYRSALSCGFQVVEEMLSDIRTAVEGDFRQENANGSTQNSPMDSRYRQLQDEIVDITRILSEVKATLHLELHREKLGAIVMSRCSKMWEILCDLKTSRLHGYGETPQELPEFLDPRIDEMIKRIDTILELLKPPRNK